MECKDKLWNTTYKCSNLEVSGPIKGLYTWSKAMQLELPDGWRVASDYDWFKVSDYFANNAFELIQGLGLSLDGYRYTNGKFFVRGSHAILWSSSEFGCDAWYRFLYSGLASVARLCGHRDRKVGRLARTHVSD